MNKVSDQGIGRIDTLCINCDEHQLKLLNNIEKDTPCVVRRIIFDDVCTLCKEGIGVHDLKTSIGELRVKADPGSSRLWLLFIAFILSAGLSYCIPTSTHTMILARVACVFVTPMVWWAEQHVTRCYQYATMCGCCKGNKRTYDIRIPMEIETAAATQIANNAADGKTQWRRFLNFHVSVPNSLNCYTTEQRAVAVKYLTYIYSHSRVIESAHCDVDEERLIDASDEWYKPFSDQYADLSGADKTKIKRYIDNEEFYGVYCDFFQVERDDLKPADVIVDVRKMLEQEEHLEPMDLKTEGHQPSKKSAPMQRNAPSITEKTTHFSNNVESVRNFINERARKAPKVAYDDPKTAAKRGKMKPVQGKPDAKRGDLLRKRMELAVTKLLKTVFKREHIEAELAKIGDIKDFVSSKVSEAELENRVNNINGGNIGKEEFNVKRETASGRNPRARGIIDCGTECSTLNSLVYHLIEHCATKLGYLGVHTIKNKAKNKAMNDVMLGFNDEEFVRLLGRLRRDCPDLAHISNEELICKIIEGDGSAWDLHCSKAIREIIELRIIDHFLEVVCKHQKFFPAGDYYFRIEREKGVANVNRWKVVKITDENEKIVKTFELVEFVGGLRKSGHRGTSIMNLFINLVVWVSIICDTQQINAIFDALGSGDHHDALIFTPAAAGPSKNSAFPIGVGFFFEGDDSLLKLVFKKSALLEVESWEDVLQRYKEMWEYECDFAMKIFDRQHVCTFTGWHLQVCCGHTTGVGTPDILRRLKGSAWLKSNLQGANKGKVDATAFAANLAYAHELCEKMPGLASVYLSFAKGLQASVDLHKSLDEQKNVARDLKRDMKYKLGNLELTSTSASNLIDQIEMQAHRVHPTPEEMWVNTYLWPGYLVARSRMLALDWNRLEDMGTYRRQLALPWWFC